ncbi:hypothetical protein HDU93_008970 [Gonapodya sp. JEL0774]|nr:hypothetical protein HDU93_008970 [Gonapodya sp. JEL0774]
MQRVCDCWDSEYDFLKNDLCDSLGRPSRSQRKHNATASSFDFGSLVGYMEIRKVSWGLADIPVHVRRDIDFHSSLNGLARLLSEHKVKRLAMGTAYMQLLDLIPPEVNLDSVISVMAPLLQFSAPLTDEAALHRVWDTLKRFPSVSELHGELFFPISYAEDPFLDHMRNSIPEALRRSVKSLFPATTVRRAVSSLQYTFLFATQLYPNLTELGVLWINTDYDWGKCVPSVWLPQNQLSGIHIFHIHIELRSIEPAMIYKRSEMDLQHDQNLSAIMQLLPNVKRLKVAFSVERDIRPSLDDLCVNRFGQILRTLIRTIPKPCRIELPKLALKPQEQTLFIELLHGPEWPLPLREWDGQRAIAVGRT